ncbi:hypothetical protein NtRootA4_41490 (plasmid) [Arthrobacter sp. NtRootA4]|nr:hypothetical protein NtRootA2_42270 [Arthrobacter sp. NtRootA2]BCW17170.1 hypothetical protein NtRootA4_41490 [Arthrobacter sp. NtRootA4]BCW25278.1 hypothetical protein NtRootC7_41450 [Arthrobacter sp. NtRootC7]BCW29640.1 hypothetical protein NtRootC45_42400 [Arthrobacter sp. NtRootC45]BCW33823.1 hypothetical protein NtRootD5_41540 [Arthrobacter sp. NtRootD5]GGV41488.1 hypothetical protein GCM10010212_33030 [Paenarthrobacter nicotinovorans]
MQRLTLGIEKFGTECRQQSSPTVSAGASSSPDDDLVTAQVEGCADEFSYSSTTSGQRSGGTPWEKG